MIVIRVSDTDIKALSATCTHLDCIVGYKKDLSQVYCNCHGGAYDVNGRNISGPPPRPLTPLQGEPRPEGRHLDDRRFQSMK